MATQDFNLYTHFAERFAGLRSKTLLDTADGTAWSYADVDERSARIANALTAAGAAPGDRITVQVEKSPEALCLYLACLRAGLVFHPLNTAYKTSEVEYFLTDAEPAVVVCDPGALDETTTLAKKAGARAVLTLAADGAGTLSERAADAPAEFATVARERDDLAALLYSSGTTGQPKGVMLSHFNLLSNTETLVDAWGFSESDRLLHALPIFHVHGLFVAIGCVMLSGASMRWLAGFNTDAVVRYLPECSVLMGVPTYYTRLLANEAFTAAVASDVRLFVSGSAPLLAETFHAFEARTGQRILERYGMTETNMNTSNPLVGERKAGTVGPPLPGVEVRICDDDGAVLGTNQVGHLQLKGPNVFRGYWRKPEKTAEDFTEDGFFNTGDMGSIDADGYVSIVGRNKDMIITGGLNVYPQEVESFLNDMPEVRESAVIGVPHPDFGEGVVAVIVTEADATIDEGEVIAACKADIADFKVPKRCVAVSELPRNTMGKVMKNVLRDTYQSLFTSSIAGSE